MDIENEIFDACATALEAEHDDVLVTSRSLNAPSSFPAVSIVESGSITDASRRDGSGIERGTIVTYDVTCYSNLRTGAKSQAKGMAQTVDQFMVAHNFKRTFRAQGDLPRDASVYQVRSRYIAGVTDTGKLYGR